MFKYRRLLALATFAMVSFVICSYVWTIPNRVTRRQVRYELLHSKGDRPSATLTRLEPYVRIGEDINTVKRRICVTNDENVYHRNSTLAIGLGDVNLELAIAKGGQIVGIGRHIHGEDDGEIWFAPPQWKTPLSPSRPLKGHSKALDAEPPIASFLKSKLTGGGPVNGTVIR